MLFLSLLVELVSLLTCEGACDPEGFLVPSHSLLLTCVIGLLVAVAFVFLLVIL